MNDFDYSWHSILHCSGLGIGIVDPSEQFRFINQDGARIFGLTPEAMIGHSLHEYILGQDHATMRRHTVARKTGMASQYHLLFRRADGENRHLEVISLPILIDRRLAGILGLFRDITDQKVLEDELFLLQSTFEKTTQAIVITERDGTIAWANPAFSKLTGYTVEEAKGRKPSILKSGRHDQAFYEHLWQTILRGETWKKQLVNRRKDGTLYDEEMTITAVANAQDQITHFVAIKEDVTERVKLEKEHVQMELQLRHAQKMEAIGQLAAGIAHEINSPTQFIGDNLVFLSESLHQLIPILSRLEELLASPPSASMADWDELRGRLQEADWSFLREEIPNAIAQSLEGVKRVTRIVKAMKDFSHPGSENKTHIDLVQAIESTITVSRNEWKYVADVTTDYDPQLPQLYCLPGEFNQVVLNLIVNAAHAIADAQKQRHSTEKGRICIRTRKLEDWAEISVADSGTGIPAAVQGRIFEPFFTTKPVGKGTGQGLPIAHSVVVKKHGGTIHFETVEGVGTTFILRFPLI